MNCSVRRVCRSLVGTVFAGVILLIMSSSASAQNLYVSDYIGFRGIYEITPGGVQSNFVSGLNRPLGLAFNCSGNLFVTDGGTGSIYEFTNLNGTLSSNLTLFASGLNQPYGLAFDCSGNLFEADFSSGQILEFTNKNETMSSTPTVFASGLKGPIELAFDNAGNLYESDFSSGKINEFTNNAGTLATNLIVFASGLNSPGGLAFDAQGALYVANDSPLGSITKITPNGTPSTFATGLNQPLGLAFNIEGDLFVANQNANNVIEIAPDGTQSIFASQGSGNSPSGVAFAPMAKLQAATTNKMFHLTVSSASPYYSTIIETSTDLVNWVPIYTNMPPYTFTQPMTGAGPYRFYRTVLGQ
jgi:sugar lactone lactonase YvrE